MKYKAIHFDMDGVIADTELLHMAAEQQACRDYDINYDPACWAGFKGMTARAVFGYLLEEYGDPQKHTVEELIDHKTNIFLELAQTKLEPIDGALDFLQWARDNHETMALVTSSNRRVQECIIGSFGIGHYFDSIVTGDDIVNGKPHPEPYLCSLKKTGALAEHSVVIEDSMSGIKSALAARCSVLAIATSHSVDELKSALPTMIAKNYRQARKLLQAR